MREGNSFSSLCGAIEEALVVVDERGSIVCANEEAERILVREGRTLVGTPLRVLFWGDEPESVDVLLQRGARGKSTASLCFGVPGERASEADVVVWPLRDSGATKIAVLVHDLTGRSAERERMLRELESQRAMLGENSREAALRASELETALETRHRFYASMSHELRTPVNAIVGYSELLLDGIYGELDPAQARILRRSLRAAGHLQELVNDLLDLARIEEGRLDLRAEEVDAGELVEELLDSVRPLVDERSLELRHERESDTPRIVSDPRRIRKIVLHLLTNAIKYGGDGPITIRSAGAQSPEGGVSIEVSDQGAGIAPEQLERIFGEFVRERSDGEGTGLGLSIARGLSRALGGTLDAESTPGEGSTFRLTLPRSLNESATDVELTLPLRTVQRHTRGRQQSQLDSNSRSG